MEAHQIHSLEDQRLWSAEHDAWVKSAWKQQWAQNEIFDKRLVRLEMRMFLLAGAGSILGGFIASLLP